MDVASPMKEVKDNTERSTIVEKTANTAVSSQLAIQSDDEDDMQDLFDYDNIKSLRRVQCIDEEYELGRVIG